MDFEPTEEQAMLADSVDRLAHQSLARAGRASHEADTIALWRHFAELGWLGIGIPEEEGGVGGGPVETMIIANGIGRGLLLVPYLSSVVLGAGLVQRAGTVQQRRTLLPAIAAGTVTLAVAIGEPGRREDPLDLDARAVATPTGYAISGKKSLVLDAGGADKLVIAARRDGGHGIGLFLANRRAPGVTLVECRTADGRAAADLALDGLIVDRHAVLGDGADATPALCAVLDRAIAMIAAEAVGAMEECIRLTGAYLGTRKQFGAPLASFQALRHRFADMKIELEQSRSLTMVAAMALAEGAPDAGRLAAMAKARVGQAARAVGEGSIQLHGGIGMTAEYAAGDYYKRLIMTDLLFGNREAQLRRLAADLIDDAAGEAGAGSPC